MTDHDLRSDSLYDAQALAKRMAQIKLTDSQRALYFLLLGRPEGVLSRDLARIMHINTSKALPMLNALHAKGYVSRAEVTGGAGNCKSRYRALGFLPPVAVPRQVSVVPEAPAPSAEPAMTETDQRRSALYGLEGAPEYALTSYQRLIYWRIYGHDDGIGSADLSKTLDLRADGVANVLAPLIAKGYLVQTLRVVQHARSPTEEDVYQAVRF